MSDIELEEYARQRINIEELHAGEVDKMLRHRALSRLDRPSDGSGTAPEIEELRCANGICVASCAARRCALAVVQRRIP